jgi:crossover junction endodeoxyribonuclease RuvC
MIILGIDPGSTRIGYGVIAGPRKLELIDYGTINNKREETSKLISNISVKISELIRKHQPDIVGIEKLYFSKNVKTGIEVALPRPESP